MAAHVTRSDIASFLGTLDRFCHEYDRAKHRVTATVSAADWQDSRFRRFEQDLDECTRSLDAIRNAVDRHMDELNGILRSIDRYSER